LWSLYEKISEFGTFVSTDLPPRGYWLVFNYHDGRMIHRGGAQDAEENQATGRWPLHGE